MREGGRKGGRDVKRICSYMCCTLYSCTTIHSLVPGLQEKWPGQFKLYMAVTSQQLHSSSEVHVILLIFLPTESGLSCRFCDGKQAEDEQTKVIVQSANTSAIKRSTIVMNGGDSKFQHMTQFGLLLSCDNVLKSDWYCQFSGSGSNSLNSHKLPGHFYYGLGMRLHHTMYTTVCWK